MDRLGDRRRHPAASLAASLALLSGAMASDKGPRTAIVTGGAKRIGAAHLPRPGRGRLAPAHPLQSLAAARRRRWRPSSAMRGSSAPISPGPRPPAAIIAALDGLPPPRLLVNNASRFAHDGADDFTVEELGRAYRDQPARAGAAVPGVSRRRPGEGALIVNLLDAKLRSPIPISSPTPSPSSAWPA